MQDLCTRHGIPTAACETFTQARPHSTPIMHATSELCLLVWDGLHDLCLKARQAQCEHVEATY